MRGIEAGGGETCTQKGETREERNGKRQRETKGVTQRKINARRGTGSRDRKYKESRGTQRERRRKTPEEEEQGERFNRF